MMQYSPLAARDFQWDLGHGGLVVCTFSSDLWGCRFDPPDPQSHPVCAEFACSPHT